jgi:glutathione S-transferase
MTEGPAIVQYIADRVPEKALAPENGTPDRYRLQSWLNFVSTELHKGFTPLFNAGLPEDVKTLFRGKLAPVLKWLDGALQGRRFLVGETFSVADAYLFTVTMPYRAKRAGLDLAPYANLLAYREGIASRPAVIEAMKAEGIL